MIHKMKLQPVPFNMIRDGLKTVELRLYDEKRRRIAVGDGVEFTSTETGEVIYTEVIALHRFNSFEELYRAIPLTRCGYTEETVASAKAEDMLSYYSPEEQKKYGVVGIEISLKS